MIIGHLSDLHISLGQPGFGGVDALDAARRAIAYLASLRPRPDVLVITGDIASSADGHRAVRDALETTGIPYFAIVGNHDSRDSLAEVFGYEPAPGRFVQYVVDDFELRILALDSKRDDHGDGLLCAERLAWLEHELTNVPDKPTILLLHHPPMRTGLWWSDGPGLGGSAQLEGIVRGHPQVLALLCGHVHSAASTMWANTMVQAAPATCWTAALDLAEPVQPRASVESPRAMVHALIDGALVTHVTTVTDEPPGEVNLMRGWDNMKAFMLSLIGQRSSEEASQPR